MFQHHVLNHTCSVLRIHDKRNLCSLCSFIRSIRQPICFHLALFRSRPSDGPRYEEDSCILLISLLYSYVAGELGEEAQDAATANKSVIENPVYRFVW